MSDHTEASERALRSLRDEGSGSSRTPLLNAKIERSLSPPLRPSSPDQTCAICLGEITDKSVTDSCFHRFCFTCLSEWSKVKPECPLCKARFTAIYHGIKSMNDFQVYRLDQSRNLSQPIDSLDTAAALDPHIFINVAVQRAFTGRFGYRTTMGLNRTRGPGGHYIWGPPGGHDVMGAVPVSLPIPPSSRPLRVNIPSYTTASSAAPSSSSRRSNVRHRGMEFRKNVYRQNLWARPIDQSRIRESSPEFYRANLAQTHRLVPWLARELAALSDMGTGFRFELACRDILQWIRLYPINSADFKRNLVPYLGSQTDHFVHEFHQFAISPYDMQGYDIQTRYTPSTAEQEVINGNDDDMEIDNDLPLLPQFNLSVHDRIGPLRACLGQIGRPTRDISGRPRDLNDALSTFDIRSYLFPSIERPELAVPPEVIVLSSSEENGANESADSDSEVQIIGSLPPLHLRSPEQVIDLDDSSDSDVIEIKAPSPPLIEIDDDIDDFSPQSPSAPSTSNGVAGPSGMQRPEGHLTRSSARFFRPSYREYSSSSDDEVASPKKRSSKKKYGGSKRTTRSSKRLQCPKSSEFVESDDDSDDSIQDSKDAKNRRASRKELLEEVRKRRKSGDHSTSRLSRREQDSEGSGVSKKNASLPSKILASKNARKSKIDDCDNCRKKRHPRNDLDPLLSIVSSPERSRTRQQRRKRRKTSRSVSSDDDSSPPRRRRKHDKGRHDSSSSTSKGLDHSQSSSSSGFNDHSFVGGSNLARNPKAMSKKAMILQKRAAETSSPDGPPAYRYGEMVELKSPTYCSMVLDNQVDYTERAKDSLGTSEDSDSNSSTTLSMGTESAPPRHFEGLQSYTPLLSRPHSQSTSSLGSSGHAVANGSPLRSNDLPLQSPSSSYSQAKLTLKSDSIPSGPPSIASPSSDSSSTRSTASSPAPHSNNSWPELSASQPVPNVQNHSETQTPSSPPNLHRFDDSPIITLEHSPLMSPPDESSSWSTSSESPSASPPRLKSIVTRVSSPPRSPSPLVSHTNSDNTTSDEDALK